MKRKTAHVFVLKQNFSSFIKHIEEKKKGGGVLRKKLKLFWSVIWLFSLFTGVHVLRKAKNQI